MSRFRLLTVAALAAAAIAPAFPAHADPLNGCTTTSGVSCTFVANGPTRYVAAGLAGCTFEVIRNWSTVYTFSGNLPPTGTLPSVAGDTVRVYAGYAQNVWEQTRCDARDAS